MARKPVDVRDMCAKVRRHRLTIDHLKAELGLVRATATVEIDRLKEQQMFREARVRAEREPELVALRAEIDVLKDRLRNANRSLLFAEQEKATEKARTTKIIGNLLKTAADRAMTIEQLRQELEQ